ncbi:lipoate--protein ligase family protein [Radiobacillus kanasensis]|uniref:lipoate--protein ligase family protein n=1 Tax=Radiobacillus kanasensis TaxID=2844358 RepID=UPI001E524721|nr:lipoate--protein ligase family protein [Radiobacillus kanasensis]UFT98993.1 lipoate--protein ligase family protein [Radiobacillus kanasensis]
MIDWKTFLNASAFRLIDQSEPNSKFKALHSFAVDDALAISISNGISSPAARLWVHDRTIVLGIPDARLPYVKEGTDWLKEQGYDVVVRNSGGLAVVLDSGVLNISLLLADAKSVSISDGYEAMVSFIQAMFADLTNDIKAFEVAGSYCPGEYDLSINGRKFAGISQRRVKNGTAVQIYLCVEGDGQARAKLVRQFYAISLKGEKGKFTYPNVKPETMASLEQLLQTKITVQDVKDRLIETLNQLQVPITLDRLRDDEQDWYGQRLEQMKDRNRKVFDWFREEDY